MSHLNLEWLEEHLAKHAEWIADKPDEPRYLYVKTGKYKPFHRLTVEAAIRRGYKVEAFCRNTVFYIYPKGVS